MHIDITFISLLIYCAYVYVHRFVCYMCVRECGEAYLHVDLHIRHACVWTDTGADKHVHVRKEKKTIASSWRGIVGYYHTHA